MFGIWVIRVANLGAMDDRFLAVEGFYRNDDVRTFVISGIVIFCMHGVVSYNIVSQCILLLNTVLHDITWYPWYCKLATTYIMYFIVCQALGASSQSVYLVFILVLGVWVIRVANLYDHFLTVVGY